MSHFRPMSQEAAKRVLYGWIRLCASSSLKETITKRRKKREGLKDLGFPGWDSTDHSFNTKEVDGGDLEKYVKSGTGQSKVWKSFWFMDQQIKHYKRLKALGLLKITESGASQAARLARARNAFSAAKTPSAKFGMTGFMADLFFKVAAHVDPATMDADKFRRICWKIAERDYEDFKKDLAAGKSLSSLFNEYGSYSARGAETVDAIKVAMHDLGKKTSTKKTSGSYKPSVHTAGVDLPGIKRRS